MARMSKSEREKLGRIQNLIGDGLAAYDNDRSAMRADILKPALKEAFALCIEILGNYPVPETKESGN